MKIANILPSLYRFMLLKKIGRQYVYFLTFDDGPHPGSTPLLLSLLRNYNVKATFFLVGSQAEKYPHLVNEIKQMGHVIGNHSYSHLRGTDTNTTTYINDVMKAHTIINSRYFRPPYGKITPSQFLALKKQFRIVFWTWDTLDYQIDTPIFPSNFPHIILMHDYPTAVKRLLIPLEKFINRAIITNGRFCTIDALF